MSGTLWQMHFVAIKLWLGMVKDCQKMAEIHSRDGQEPRLAKQNEREWDSRWRGQEERGND